MKHIDEYRDRNHIQNLASKISEEVKENKKYNLMEFCGSHTHSIFKYGLREHLPKNIRMVHGPGCPVCVLPIGRLDEAITLVRRSNVILTTYGDVMRVPASGRISLLRARSEGADIRMVYSCMDSLKIAIENPQKEVVFFAIGFETTTPSTAILIMEAKKIGLKNFSVYCNHVLTPAAMAQILESPEIRKIGSFQLDGFLGPAHVSAVIGTRPFEYFAYEYKKPVVVAGFEPVDVMQAILMLIRQINENRAEVENQYVRVVSREGNLNAQKCVAEVFELRSLFEWRGLGSVPYSSLRIKNTYFEFDAEKRFEVKNNIAIDHKSCQCGAIIRGVKTPTDCKLFGKICTPDNPVGPCMVSSEGACGAYFLEVP